MDCSATALVGAVQATAELPLCVSLPLPLPLPLLVLLLLVHLLDLPGLAEIVIPATATVLEVDIIVMLCLFAVAFYLGQSTQIGQIGIVSFQRGVMGRTTVG